MLKEPKDPSHRRNGRAAGAVTLGAGLGMIAGAAFHNPGMGLVLGAAGGVLLGVFLRRRGSG